MRTALALTVALAVAAPAAATPLPLQSVRGNAPRIEDSAGRQVLLRGVNVNQLGDYYRANPRWEQVVPLTAGDFDRIAALGFNSVRLLVHWSALEPRPGEFDQGYVARIKQALRWAASRELYVIVDMHQDAWGKHIATPPDETCAPGFSPANGWDGAPAWATLTDGLATCKAGIREVSPAVGRAWQSFYENRAGIQAALVRTWGRLAGELAAEPAVAGWDLLNEPNPGLAFGSNQSAELGRFYGRAIEAIRQAERRVRGGFSHIAFFEPSVEWSAFGTTATPAADFTSDPNIVFAPHLYGDSITVTPVTVEQGFDLAQDAARRYGTTVWSGEWGWFGDPGADAAEITRYARQEDARLLGGAWWSWKQACGDPHVVPQPGAEPNEVSPSLVRYSCKGRQRELGIPASTQRILSRATVRAAPGAIASLVSDPASGAFQVRGSDRDGGACTLAAWMPGAGRPRFAGSGIGRVHATRVRGGWRISTCARGEWSLRLSGRDRPGHSCRAALRLRSRHARLRGRRTIVRLRSRAAEGRCKGTVTLRARRDRRLLQIGRAGFALDPGRRRRVRIRLTRPGARLVRAAGRRGLTTRMSLAGRDVDANRFAKRLYLRVR